MNLSSGLKIAYVLNATDKSSGNKQWGVRQ